MQNDQLDYQSLLPLGTLLQMGKYRVDKYLSSGGFGNTYVITNLQFEEQFAMKEFFMRGINERNEDNTTISVSNKTNRPQFEQQREKFKKEARRLRKLHNEHIVQVHDLFEENGTAYYVMDFIDGESLSNLIKRTGKPIKEERTLLILDQVLDALQTVHEKSIWHLDLKPANIMLDKNGNAVLIDFGASKQMSVSDGYTSTTTAMCYTKGYAPAEQVDQKIDNIGPWTDLYALGATLYNLLTKKDPPLISEIFMGNAFDFPKNVSEKTKNLILWLMTPNHEKRPSSVQEVRAYLNDSQEQNDEDREVTVLASKKVESKKSIWKFKNPFSPKEQKLLLGVMLLAVLISFTLSAVKVIDPIADVRIRANMGDARAQYNLGLRYDNGQGVSQDYTEAVKWYRKAADQGHARAQYNLGLCYDNGQGVSQDYTEAVKWYRKAADQGNVDAQYNLGYCYYNGQGVSQDYAEAVKWYRKAADQGYVEAISILDTLVNHNYQPAEKDVALKKSKREYYEESNIVQ